MHIRKPSPATAIAVLALFVALGGSALAAGHYTITRANQIKPSVLKAIQASGPELLVTSKPAARLQPGHIIEAAEVRCPSGYHIVTGGYFGHLAAGASLAGDEPVDTNGWEVMVDTAKSTDVSEVLVSALCAPGGLRLLGELHR